MHYNNNNSYTDSNDNKAVVQGPCGPTNEILQNPQLGPCSPAHESMPIHLLLGLSRNAIFLFFSLNSGFFCSQSKFSSFFPPKGNFRAFDSACWFHTWPPSILRVRYDQQELYPFSVGETFFSIEAKNLCKEACKSRMWPVGQTRHCIL